MYLDVTFCTLENYINTFTIVNGGFAEYCAYPAGEALIILEFLIQLLTFTGKVFKIHNLSDVEATLLEPASCAAHGLDKISPRLGSSVLMFGAGKHITTPFPNLIS